MKKLHHPLLIILLLILCSCGEEQHPIEPSGKTIKIGFIGPMSGPEKSLGEHCLEGVQTALFMKPYLHNGDTVELIVKDDRNEPELSVEVFKKLVLEDEVKAVIISSTSASVLAVNAICDHYQVPLLVLLATHPEISKDTKFVTQICFDDTIQGKVAALFVRDELLLGRVAVFKNPESTHSNSLANEFIRKFRETEGEIQDVILVSSESIDYETILPRLRDQDVELLYMPLDSKYVLDISMALRKSNWAPLVMGGDGLLTNALAQQDGKVGSLLENYLTIEPYSYNLETTTLGKKAFKTFTSLFQTRNSIHPAMGFEGMAILLHAMNRCHDPTQSECINSRLHETRNFEGIMGKISIASGGKAERPVIINRIRRDKLEFVVKVY